MNILSKEIIDAVNDEIIETAQQEAKEILFLTSDINRKDFLTTYHQNRGNICCLILDYAKRDLIKSNKLTLKESDHFGHIYYEKN